ncbi:lipoprotein-releasing ABC transporter permease subunit [Magnetococcales bacterium HHB-1]
MMQRWYEVFIGLRYLRAKRSQRFINVIAVLSTLGITLGVAALIVVLAVMTGFKTELQRQILGVTGHVLVQPHFGAMANYQEVLSTVEKVNNVQAASPFILGQAMLAAQGRSVGVMLRGIDPIREKRVSSLADNLMVGKLKDLSGYGIILGRDLASILSLVVGDKVTVLVPTANMTPIGTMPRMRRFRVVGIFESGMHDYDNTLAYVALEDAAKLLRLGDRVSGIEIRTPHPDLAFEVREKVYKKLDEYFWVRDWMQMNRNFFRALKMEKATMFVILFLVVVVAAFNIISSLIMAVMDKRSEIAILKTMGARSGSIMMIFLVNGGIIGIIGTLCGMLLGLTLAWNLEPVLAFVERTFGIQILSGDVYFIDHLPSVVERSDVVWICGISLIISFVAALYPAWRASRIDPVEALRYE